MEKECNCNRAGCGECCARKIDTIVLESAGLLEKEDKLYEELLGEPYYSLSEWLMKNKDKIIKDTAIKYLKKHNPNHPLLKEWQP